MHLFRKLFHRPCHSSRRQIRILDFNTNSYDGRDGRDGGEKSSWECEAEWDTTLVCTGCALISHTFFVVVVGSPSSLTVTIFHREPEKVWNGGRKRQERVEVEVAVRFLLSQ